ncbi:MAG: hypothetical protein ABIM89_10195, partial [Mycobacteriales bacterium]
MAASVVTLGSFALATPAQAEPTPELTTDSRGAPLLAGGQLGPGSTRENCIVLSYKRLQSDSSNGVGMYAFVTGSGLADYLDLTIAAGSGGRYGDCTGFAGSLIYSGTLDQFGSAHSAPSNQLAVAIAEGDTGSVSVRVRLRLRDDNAAQGKSADALFSWTVGSMTPLATSASSELLGGPSELLGEPGQTSGEATPVIPSVGGVVETAAATPLPPPVGGVVETAEPAPARPLAS